MDELLTRLEAADEKAQYEVIGDVLKFAREQDWIDQDTYNWAFQCRNLGAFLDAARVLVPEGMAWQVTKMHGAGLPDAVGQNLKRSVWVNVEAATPALALCIAALKARQTAPVPPEDAAQRLPGEMTYD